MKVTKNKYFMYILLTLSMVLFFVVILNYKTNRISEEEALVREVYGNKEDSKEISEQYTVLLEHLFNYRNKAILNKNEDILKGLYDTDIKFGLWAYEHEVKKMKYLENWSSKQGVNFDDIKTKVKIKKMKEREENLYGIICDVSTEYKYSYENEPDKINMFRIGTYHYLHVRIKDGNYIITKEWYTDPFADSLNLENIKSDDIKNYIIKHEEIHPELTKEQEKAIEYAHRYCGAAADEEFGLKFNTKYRDFNCDGGDCANFASQIMYESGRFKKNAIWNYENGSATKAWVNAQGFKNYIVNSGRGSYISKGSYEEVYREAYNLRPGDFVGYEKEGRITHVSTITGFDSKGYPLVTCHNTDRLLVPWDLGWSDKAIKFHLIKVNY